MLVLIKVSPKRFRAICRALLSYPARYTWVHWSLYEVSAIQRPRRRRLRDPTCSRLREVKHVPYSKFDSATKDPLCRVHHAASQEFEKLAILAGVQIGDQQHGSTNASIARGRRPWDATSSCSDPPSRGSDPNSRSTPVSTPSNTAPSIRAASLALLYEPSSRRPQTTTKHDDTRHSYSSIKSR